MVTVWKSTVTKVVPDNTPCMASTTTVLNAYTNGLCNFTNAFIYQPNEELFFVSTPIDHIGQKLYIYNFDLNQIYISNITIKSNEF